MGDVRVFVLDDHAVVRAGLVALIGAAEGLLVVGEAGTAAEARRRIPATRPDVIVLDMLLPDGTGIEAYRDAKAELPDVAGLVLTAHADEDALIASVVAGAGGYLLKRVSGQGLVDAIRRVAAGESLLDPSMVGQLLTRLRTPDPTDPRLKSLSEQERRVLDLVAEGLTNRQVGSKLGIAEPTVKNHVTAVLHKLGLRSRTQAALFVTQQTSR